MKSCCRPTRHSQFDQPAIGLFPMIEQAPPGDELEQLCEHRGLAALQSASAAQFALSAVTTDAGHSPRSDHVAMRGMGSSYGLHPRRTPVCRVAVVGRYDRR